MTPPDFSRSIGVSQHGNGSGGFSLIMLCTMVPMGAAFYLGMLLDQRASGVWFVLGMVVLVVLGLVATLMGIGLAMWIEGRWRILRGLAPLFNDTTQVDIDAAGLAVQGLGTVAWRDVLALEGIPDSESALIVHTRPFEKLMLQAPTEELGAVLSHYMDLQSRSGDLEQQRLAAAGSVRCRALVFDWPRFMAWIWAGYLLAATAGAVMLFAKPDAGLFKHLVMLFVLMPMVAWLVWAFPFSQLGVFAPGRVRAFELEGWQLRSGGALEFDLREACVTLRRSKGIGFDLEFISVRPFKGRGIDILIADQEQRALLEAITERGLYGKRRAA